MSQTAEKQQQKKVKTEATTSAGTGKSLQQPKPGAGGGSGSGGRAVHAQGSHRSPSRRKRTISATLADYEIDDELDPMEPTRTTDGEGDAVPEEGDEEGKEVLAEEPPARSYSDPLPENPAKPLKPGKPIASWTNEYFIVAEDDNEKASCLLCLKDRKDTVISMKGVCTRPHCSLDRSSFFFSVSLTLTTFGAHLHLSLMQGNTSGKIKHLESVHKIFKDGPEPNQTKITKFSTSIRPIHPLPVSLKEMRVRLAKFIVCGAHCFSLVCFIVLVAQALDATHATSILHISRWRSPSSENSLLDSTTSRSTSLVRASKRSYAVCTSRARMPSDAFLRAKTPHSVSTVPPMDGQALPEGTSSAFPGTGYRKNGK